MPANKNGSLPITRNEFLQFVRNTTTIRENLIRMLTGTTTRDIDVKCGYLPNPGVEDYQMAYDRHDIAARCVRIHPKESWAMTPDIYEDPDMKVETEFEQRFKELNQEFSVFSKLHDIDKLSGIGRFGILLIGINDGKDLSKPVDGIDEQGNRTGEQKYELTFLRAFAETHVTVKELERNPANKRFGQPTMYTVKFVDPKEGIAATPVPSNSNGKSEMYETQVHWHRVIHVADNREASDVFGIPRLQQVFNRLYDVRKILGGDGEGMWKGGFPGISIQTHPSIENPELDVEATKEELENYMDGLQRYLIGVGTEAKTLGSEVADPKPHFEMHIMAICIVMEVPMRVFLGSEEGRLASGQDMRTWNSRVMERQNLYLTPFLILPVLQRFIAFGILPKPKQIIVDWPDRNAPTENDRATHAQKVTEAIVKYVASGASQLIPPLWFFTIVLGFKQELVEKLLAAAAEYNIDTLPLAEDILTPPEELGGDAKQPGKDEGAGRQ